MSFRRIIFVLLPIVVALSVSSCQPKKFTAKRNEKAFKEMRKRSNSSENETDKGLELNKKDTDIPEGMRPQLNELRYSHEVAELSPKKYEKRYRKVYKEQTNRQAKKQRKMIKKSRRKPKNMRQHERRFFLWRWLGI